MGEIPVGFAISAGREAFSVSGNGLNGTIPADLGALPKLSSPSLSNNLLSGHIPVPIGNDFNLAVPSLRNNQLNGSIPIELGAVSNLEESDIGRNELSSSIPGDLQTAAGRPILVRTETTFRPSTSLRTICRASFQQLLPQGLTLLHLPEIHSRVAPHLRVHRQSVIVTQTG
jgi:hypothetical protein